MRTYDFIAKESFAILREIENKKWDGKSSYSEWKVQIEKERTHAIKNLVPYVGLGCTICYYSDRRAATVTKIISPCKIEVTFNQVRCIDYYSGEYEILPELEGAPRGLQKEETDIG